MIVEINGDDTSALIYNDVRVSLNLAAHSFRMYGCHGWCERWSRIVFRIEPKISCSFVSDGVNRVTRRVVFSSEKLFSLTNPFV